MVYFPGLGQHQLLFSAGVVVIVFLVLSNTVSLLSDVYRARYAHGLGGWLQIRMLTNMVSRPYAHFLSVNSGVQLKKIGSDIGQYVNGVLLPALDSVPRTIFVVTILLASILIDPIATVALAVLFGVSYFLLFVKLGRRRRSNASKLKHAGRGIMVEAQQLLGGVKTVKVHGVESYFLDRFGKHASKYARHIAEMSLYQHGPRYVMETVVLVGLVVFVLVSSSRGEDLLGYIPTLGFIAIAVYRLLPSIQLLYSNLTQVTSSIHALEEVYDEFSTFDKKGGGADAVEKSDMPELAALNWNRGVTIDSVTFSYPGVAKPVFENLSFEIEWKSSLGIIGKTGSGKSTLVDLVLGLHLPTSGRILIDREELTAVNCRAWQAGIGYVPQEIFLIDDTIAANIAFGVPAHRVELGRLREAAEAAQILTFIEGVLPQSWETRVGERGVKLSGGQRQRIGIARALYSRPTLLILDEATSALDLETEGDVMAAIDGLNGRITMLIIAHRISTLKKCSRIIDLNVFSEPLSRMSSIG